MACLSSPLFWAIARADLYFASASRYERVPNKREASLIRASNSFPPSFIANQDRAALHESKIGFPENIRQRFLHFLPRIILRLCNPSSSLAPSAEQFSILKFHQFRPFETCTKSFRNRLVSRQLQIPKLSIHPRVCRILTFKFRPTCYESFSCRVSVFPISSRDSCHCRLFLASNSTSIASIASCKRLCLAIV